MQSMENLMKRTVSLALILSVGLALEVLASNNCYTVLAGRGTTADGSVMLAHNEDNGIQYVACMKRVERAVHPEGAERSLDGGGSIPEADTTWAYWILEMPGLDFSHALVNEKGVAVVSDNCPSREDRPELIQGGAGRELRILVAERARSAREGARLVGELVGRFGYNQSGRTLIIADSREGWFVAMVNGRHWVAARVPDDRVSTVANNYNIRRVDLADTLDFMGSPDLVDYAASRGWYDPERDGEFDFARAYARQDRLDDPTQTHRQWSGLEQVAPGAVPPPEPGSPLPFSIVPSRKLSPPDLFRVLRDHYEGTPFAAHEKQPHDPQYGPGHPICTFSTNSGSVFQLRDGFPAEIGVAWWLALWRPCASTFVPLYPWAGEVPSELSFPVVPEAYRDASAAVQPGVDKALRVFRDLSLFVDQDYRSRIGTVRAWWESFETRRLALQRSVESRALELYPLERETALDLLDTFSRGSLTRAMQQARDFTGD